MTKATIYHNPRCSKSRKALELLRLHGCDVTVVEYLKTPPDAGTLELLLKKLHLSPAELIRGKEHRALGLTDTQNAHELVKRMTIHPAIIERPIVVVGRRAVLGRPPERVLELL